MNDNSTRTIQVIDAEIKKLQAERAVLVRARRVGLQLGRHDEVAVGVPGRLVTLDGRPIAGTYEVTYGMSNVATGTRNADGSIVCSHAGGTDWYSDKQKTFKNSLDEIVFLDEDGEYIHECQVKLVPEGSDGGNLEEEEDSGARSS